MRSVSAGETCDEGSGQGDESSLYGQYPLERPAMREVVRVMRHLCKVSILWRDLR